MGDKESENGVVDIESQPEQGGCEEGRRQLQREVRVERIGKSEGSQVEVW